MDFHFHTWLDFTLRWLHLIFGISWIGNSFYFMWLDSHLEAPNPPLNEVEGSLWMVHSGGFYQVERRRIGPGQMPSILHWFKWEATFTWVSGFFLLGVVYYMTGGAYLVDPAIYKMTPALAALLGISMLAGGWLVYDLLWRSKLAKIPGLAAGVSLLLLSGLIYSLCHLFSGRGAFIHVGALFGTLMVLNVWVHILPSQQQMIDATKRGETPNFDLSSNAKKRSTHNSYMTFPVIFIMLSNHYPMTYSHPFNWMVLILLILIGSAIRHTLIAKNQSGRWAYIPATAAAAALFFLVGTPNPKAMNSDGASFEKVPFATAKNIITARCVACHSTHPADPTFGPTPGGVDFENTSRIHALSERIRFRAVITKTMPLANKTGITEAERTLLGHWVDQGASIDE